jgi:hypothetical protein
VGPILSTIVAKNERECELACHMADPDVCGMFNYYTSAKICELLYRDRPAEYRLVRKKGSTSRAHKVSSFFRTFSS